MKLLKFISNLFRGEPKSPMNKFEKIIRKMGYKAEGEGAFFKESSNGTTYIWTGEDGVKIKVYSSGYAESDFLTHDLLTAGRLKQFIRENEL